MLEGTSFNTENEKEDAQQLEEERDTTIEDFSSNEEPVSYQYSTVPEEIKGFNWGAFGLSIFWGIGNKAYLSLLCLIPFFNFIWMFVCGFKGNEWAWKNGQYQNVEEFKKVQDSWKLPGIISFIISTIGIILYFIMFMFFFSIGLISGLQEGLQTADYDYNYSEFDEFDFSRGEIGDIPGWTTDIYSDIKLATLVTEENGAHTYSNGSTFSDLIKKTGEPHSSYRDGNTVTADWSTSDYDASVTITYDVATDQIISKDSY